MSELTPITRIESYLDAIVNSGTPPLEDITRIETFLQAIYDNQVCALTPITRIEMFLGKISGQDIVLPEPITRIELYLAAIAGEDVELPEEPITRIEMYLADWAEGGDWTTISGAIVEFVTQRAHKLKSCVVTLEPKQDLHGYDAPWPAGGGKNLGLMSDDNIQNAQRCTFVYQNNGVVASANGTYGRANFHFSVQSGETYTISLVGSNDREIFGRLYYGNTDGFNAEYGTSIFTTSEATYTKTFTATNNDLYVSVYVTGSNETAGVMTIKNFMLEKGSSATTFAPFENICPISGWTGCEVTRTGKNLFDKAKAKLYSNVARFIKYGVDDYSDNTPNGDCVLDVGTYTLSISGDGTENPTSLTVFDSDGNRINIVYNNKIMTFTTTETGAYFLTINFHDTVTWADYNIQLESGSTATDYEPFRGNSYSVTFGETVYGATPNIVSVEMPVTWNAVDLGTFRWAYNSTFNCFYAENPPQPFPKNGFTALCSQYKFVGSYQNLVDKSCAYIYNNTIAVRDSAYGTDATAFKAAMSGVQLVYELATPIQTTITSTPITALKGYNAMWSDGGDITVAVKGTPVELSTQQALNMLLGGAYHNNQTADDVSDEEALDIILGGENK